MHGGSAIRRTPASQASHPALPVVVRTNCRSRFSTVSIVSSRVSKVRPRNKLSLLETGERGPVLPQEESPPPTPRLGEPRCVFETPTGQCHHSAVTGPGRCCRLDQTAHRHLRREASQSARLFSSSSALLPHRNLARSMMPVHCHDVVNGGKRRETINPQGAHARVTSLKPATLTRQRMGHGAGPR